MRKVAAPDGEHLQQQAAERLTRNPDFGRELAGVLVS